MLSALLSDFVLVTDEVFIAGQGMLIKLLKRIFPSMFSGEH